MAWKCPRCNRINHTSPSSCSCGQRVRSSTSTSRPTDDGLDLIDVMIIADTFSVSNSDSSYDTPFYSSSDSCTSSADSGSSSCD